MTEDIVGSVFQEQAQSSLPTQPEKIPTVPFSEVRIPLRREIIQKDKYSLEKNYYEEPGEKGTPVEIIFIQNDERTDLRVILGVENAQLYEDYSATGCSVDLRTNTIYFPRQVIIASDHTEYRGLSMTHSSYVESVLLKTGRVAEVHDYLALRGSLIRLAHEAGHITYEEKHPEEKVRRQALQEKVQSVEYDMVEPVNAQEFISVVGRAELGAWKEADQKIYSAVKSGKDITDGMTLSEIVTQYETCIQTYDDAFTALKKAASTPSPLPVDVSHK